MEYKKKYKNGLGVASLVFFLIGAIILAQSIYVGRHGGLTGFYTIAGMFVAVIPFFISWVLALINICKHYFGKSNMKCNKVFLIFDWGILAIGVILGVFVQIYPFLLTTINMMGK